jgi:drug/metabolite transporter (DMT)-like permease
MAEPYDLLLICQPFCPSAARAAAATAAAAADPPPGLLSVTASATQMMRQSLLPFTAVLGFACWRKRLNGYHAAGIAGCVVSGSPA